MDCMDCIVFKDCEDCVDCVDCKERGGLGDWIGLEEAGAGMTVV